MTLGTLSIVVEFEPRKKPTAPLNADKATQAFGYKPMAPKSPSDSTSLTNNESSPTSDSHNVEERNDDKS
ncbi:MAG: hypothetical protein ABI947_16565 [Chloroflexota bacterium]